MQWALGTALTLGTVHAGTWLHNHFCNLSFRQSWDSLLLTKNPQHTKDGPTKEKSNSKGVLKCPHRADVS